VWSRDFSPGGHEDSLASLYNQPHSEDTEWNTSHRR